LLSSNACDSGAGGIGTLRYAQRFEEFSLSLNPGSWRNAPDGLARPLVALTTAGVYRHRASETPWRRKRSSSRRRNEHVESDLCRCFGDGTNTRMTTYPDKAKWISFRALVLSRAAYESE